MFPSEKNVGPKKWVSLDFSTGVNKKQNLELIFPANFLEAYIKMLE